MIKNRLLGFLILNLFLSSFKHSTAITPQEANELLGIELTKATSIVNQLYRLERLERVSWSPYYHVMPQFIERYNLKVGCEIGVSMGLHSEAILKNSTLEKLYSVDPYIKYYDPTNYFEVDQDYYDIFYLLVKERLSKFGDRSEILRYFSHDAAAKIENFSLDFVFIDGNHTYEYVKQDIEDWYDKVKPGGFVMGDDYISMHKGVAQAVDEFFNAKNLQINQIPDQPRIWWVLKP